jgi:mannan endo-1,4-beta-mannosidase
MRSRSFHLLALSTLMTALTASAQDAPPPSPFVTASGPQLVLNGAPFFPIGANNYFLFYASQTTVDEIIDGAALNKMTVLRTWGSLEIGNQDGSDSTQGKANGVYFQYWDGAAPAYNDGEDGLSRLDYVVYKAGLTGLRLVIPFVNNWEAFGGMDQYVRWRGGSFHDEFYTDPVIRQWYKGWIAHLLNHVNIYTGVAYKDDPAIMMWELANEPRCKGSGLYPQSDTCSTATLIEWATDVSAFVKSVDPNHLVATGDEGFYFRPESSDWIDSGREGVDSLALAQIPTIDVMSFHLYPVAWGRSREWATMWILSHFSDAQSIGKPALLGEYGFEDGNLRNAVYKEWTDTVLSTGGNGALFWMLSNRTDFFGLDIQCPNEVCAVVRNFSDMAAAGRALAFPPLAGELRATTESGQPVILDPLANAAVYAGATLDPTMIDLDPATAELQTVVTLPGGSFELQTEGKIQFTPEPEFEGQVRLFYTIADSTGAVSDPAPITLTVKPLPGAPFTLFSFENGLEGWKAGDWQGNSEAGVVSLSTDFAAQGSQSLRVDTNTGGWIGVVFSPPLDLSGRTRIEYDVATTDVSTAVNLVIKAGPNYQWCQGKTWQNIPPNSVWNGAQDFDNMSCGKPDLSKIQEMYIFLGPGGTFYIDRIRII